MISRPALSAGWRSRRATWALAFLAALAGVPSPVHGESSGTRVGDALARLVADRDQITVIELSGNYDEKLPNGEVNDDPRQAIAREYFQTHPDEYDFLIIWTTFEFDTGEASAFCLPVRNDVQGIGMEVFDNSELFGSSHKLQASIDMAALSRWATDPLDPEFEATLGTLGHEILHRWGIHVRFRETDGSLSNALIGYQDAHWSFLLDTDASLEYGADWHDNGDGSFTARAIGKFWSPLDLYLAGFYTPEQVPPFFLIESPGFDPKQLPVLNATVQGTKRVLTIDDIIAGEGPRIPSALESQKEFRAAFLLVTRPGEPVTDAQIQGLNRVRRELATRFAVLTGGRGLLEVEPQAVHGEPGSPTPIPGGGTPRTTPLSLLEGLAWLRSQQTAEGWWQDTPATRLRDTAVTVTTLMALDPQFTGDAQDRALAWLRSQTGSNTDFLARLVAVLSQTSGGDPATRASLLALQNPDGGWGAGPGYGSDPVDTALAVLALMVRPLPAEAAAVARAADYLVAARSAEGGWGSVQGGPGRTTATATVLRALRVAGRDPGAAPLSWIVSRQSAADGGFGDSPSTVHDTANALEALIALQALGQINSASASAYLGSRQTTEGSWDGSVYSTALALSALKRFGFPNWSFMGTPSVLPPSPRDGERVKLAFSVVNDGNLPSPAGVLRLYEGDPSQGGQPAAADAAIPSLPPGTPVTVTVYWDSLDKPGARTLFAAIDPDGAVAELSESDNQTSLSLDVQPAPALADLEVKEPDIAISPAQPISLPVELAISVTVRNLGHADAANVAVQLLIGPAAGGTPVERKTVSIPGRSSSVVTYTYTLTTPGVTTISVVVDPEGAVTEDQEGNNSASRTVSTGASVDLAVANSDLSLVGTPFVGNDITFKAVLHNRGTVDAPAAPVRFAVTDGTTIREIGRPSILLAAGQSAERTVAWRVDLEGSLRLLVTIDPDALVPEADETNNAASLDFTTGQVTEPNLLIRTEDFTVSPNPGLEGQPLTLRAVVRNNGGQEAANVEVGFYEGDPAQGGTLLGNLQVIPSVAVSGSAEVSLTLPPLAGATAHLFFAVADPRNQVAEGAEGDNAAFQTLSVLSLPDLAVTAASIQVSPPAPRPGQPVTVTVDVANLGQQDAHNVGVRLAADGSAVGPDQTVASIPGRTVGRATFVWIFPAAGGTVRLSAVADPAGAVTESSEANNAAERTVAGVDANDPVVPRYFSPNGDGIQDTAAFGLPAPVPPGAAVEVRDISGRLVRVAAGAALDNNVFIWDGRDDQGRVVRDGDYSLTLFDATGSRLREGLATVDTDHSSLLAALGTPFEKINNLTCSFTYIEDVQFPATDDRFYFRKYHFSIIAGQNGFYRGLPNGTSIERVLPNDHPLDLRVSRDGEMIAFTSEDSWRGTKYYARSDGSGLTTIPIQSHDGPYFGFRGDTQDLVYLETVGSTSKIRLRPLDGSGPDRVVISLPAQSRIEFRQGDMEDDFSPDGRFLDFGSCDPTSGCGRRLLNLTNGQVITLTQGWGYGGFRGNTSWSPDGRYLAIIHFTSDDGGEVVVFDVTGRLVRRFEVPRDVFSAIPAYAAFRAVPPSPWTDLEVLDIFQPSWSATGEEFVFGAYYFEEGEDYAVDFGRLIRANVTTGAAETVAWLEPGLYGFSYHISTWDGSQWVERGKLHFKSLYAERQLDLTPFLPDPDGELKVRIRQTGRDAAHVDRVQLLAGVSGAEQEIPPTAATLGADDVLGQVVRFDREVLDLHEREFEVRWSGIPEEAVRQGLRLSLVAREEGPEVRNARPFEYPPEPDRVYDHWIGETGALVVDGAQTAADGLGDPLFAEWTRPDTGHPAATVYGYAKSDSTHLYAALDFTMDNTAEGERDWASLWVDTPQGPRELRITAADRQWGAVGFTHTGTVHHGHKYYEWKVPLAEISAQPGDTVSLRFQAYGSAGELPASGFLPLYGNRPLWIPGEDTALFWQEGSGSTWAVPLDDGEPRRIFESFSSFSGAYLSTSRHKLLFEDGRDILDPQHDCYNREGESSFFSYESRANLTAELSGRAAEDGHGIVLEGTAADLHFARWRLEYADESVPDFWTAIGPDDEQPVFDGVLTTWVPPRAGSGFLVRLTVEDLAGNKKSVLRRFSGAQPATTITDVSVSPRSFSPNGDGVQDATVIRYRVLAPVHLELHVDNARGDRLRTFRRDHATVGQTFEITWDGRDDRGLPVPDGEYRLVLHSFAFSVRVDTIPPTVGLKLYGPRPPQLDKLQGPSVTVRPMLSFKIDDESPYDVDYQSGEGAEPSTWSAIALDPFRISPQDPWFYAGLSFTQFMNHRFRLIAVDAAGNRSIKATGLGAEELWIDSFGQHLALDGSRAPLDPVPVTGKIERTLDRAPVRFAIIESVRQRLAQVFVQFRSSDSWVETPIQQFLEPGSASPGPQIPDPRWEVVWDLAGVVGSHVTARLRAVDLDGNEFFSNEVGFEILGGINYRGLVPGKDEGAWQSLPAGVKAALAAAKLDPDRSPVLWAEESILEPLTAVTLFLTSRDDLRYAAGRPLLLAGSTDGFLVFDGSDLAPCNQYVGYVVARTAPVTGAPRDVKSNEEPYKVPCLKLNVQLKPEAAACGATPPQRTTVLLTPESLNGTELRALFLAVTSPENVIANVNSPESGREYAFEIDTGDMAEGEYPLYARLTNGEGEEKRLRVRFVVDRSAPEAEITYPANGQRLCTVLRPNGSRGVDIEGSIEDLGGFLYRIQEPDTSSPGGWRNGQEIVLYPPVRPEEEDQVLPLRQAEKHGPIFPLIEPNGSYQFRLQVEDRGGNSVCREVSFAIDGTVEGTSLTGEPDVFSPNGDGEVDQILFRFGATEPTTVSLQIYAGKKSEVFGGPPIVSTGPPLRTLITSLQLAGSSSAVWDGRGEGGAHLPDGLHVAVARFRDGCGNPVERYFAFQLDTVPPSVVLTAPQSGTPLPMLVEVRGSVSDLLLLDYRVEFGVGSQPLTWTLLAQGSDSRANQRLAFWNTYGLSGPHVVRLSARDRAGNVGQTMVTVDLPPRDALLTELEAVPDLISPNGDGRRDSSSLRFGLAAEAQVTLQVVSAQGTAVRTLLSSQVLPAGAAVRPWDGLDDAGQPVLDGDYRVRLRAVSTADSSRTQEESVALGIDRVPPVFELSRPRSGFASTASGVAGSVRDPHLISYSISLTSTPDAPLWTEIARGTASQEDAVLAPLTDLDDGEYALLLTAADGAENRTEQVVRFSIDNTPPEVSLTAPAAQSVVGAALGAVGVSGTIEEAHLASWRLEVGAGATPTAWSSLASGTALPTSETLAAWSVAGLADGVYTLRLTAEDLAGSTSQAMVAVTVDNTPPIAAIDQPAGGYVTAPMSVTGTASDAHLLQYRLEVAPEGTQNWSELGRSVTPVVSGLLFDWRSLPPDGRYQLRLRVDDGAGNTASAVVTVTVDQHPPAAPQGLAATLENGRDARLSWQANNEADLAGYQVYREGVKVTGAPVTSPAYLDAGLLDGTFHYTVTAVDSAGLESAPSAPAEVLVDRTPPTALLHRPTAGSRVSGLVDVVVSVFAPDLAEYRLYVGAGDGSSGRQLLRRATTPASYETAAQWSTVSLPEGATYTLRLEAEDVRGNVGTVESAVIIDNLPPATPVGLAAAVSGADATLTWTKNTEADLLGYLLYRDGRLVNARGPDVGDLRALALKFLATQPARYVDLGLPDGTFRYTIAAIDQAGNVSAPSAPVSASIERRAPRATIVTPVDGTRFDRTLYILATSPDQDVAQVRFQFRAAADAAWTDIGPADTAAPWETSWDPAGLTYGDYRLRAVATDTGGRVDAAPPEIAVTYRDLERPAAPQGLAARVDGGDVHLSWSANTEADLRGYLLDRVAANGTPVRLTAQPVTGTTYVDSGLADNVYTYTLTAVDSYGNESDPSPGREAVVYTPALERPFTPTRNLTTAIAGVVASAAEVAVRVTPEGEAPISLPLVPADGQGRFEIAAIELARGTNAIAVVATDPAGNRSKTALLAVASGTPPSAPTGLAATVDGYDVHLAWNANPPAETVVGYRPFRDGEPALPQEPVQTFTEIIASSEAVEWSPAVYAFDGIRDSYWSPATAADRPSSGQWLAVRWAAPLLVAGVEVDWLGVFGPFWRAIDFDIEVWDGGGWLPIVRVRDNAEGVTAVPFPEPYRTTGARLVLRRIAGQDTVSESLAVAELRIFHHPLVAGTEFIDSTYDGQRAYTLTAVNTYGFESEPSAPVTVPVGDVTPPDPVTLTGVAAGAGAHLSWTASAAPDFSRYELYRDDTLLQSFYDPTRLAWDDAPLNNGTYRYTVRVVDQAGNASAPSNEAAVTVAVPPPPVPVGLTVTAPPSGGALDLAWQPGTGPAPFQYRILRSTAPGGPYDEIALTSGTTRRDTEVTNGTTYFYVIEALDAIGNASARSNEASGTPRDVIAPFMALHYPAFPGLPYATTDAFADVAGSSEPGVEVALYRNGDLVSEGSTRSDHDVVYGGHHQVPGTSPWLSPDGRYLWIAGYSGHSLYHFLTGTETTIGTVSGVPRWFPDSRSVVLADGGNIRAYRLSDGVVQDLATCTTTVTAIPSPEGQRLAVIGTKDGKSGLWIVDIPSGGWRLLVQEPLNRVHPTWVRWSPDGTTLARFRSEPPRAIEVVDVQTGSLRVIESLPAPSGPSWSPDSREVLFISVVNGVGQVVRYRMSDGLRRIVTAGPNSHRSPQWSPDGRSIAFIIDGQGVVRQDLATAENELLWNNWFYEDLDWVQSGYLMVRGWDGIRIELAGRVELDSIPLAGGDNVFTAVARDGSGNQSVPSEPITVRRLTGDLPDLVVTAADLAILPAVPAAGGAVSLAATVRNAGVATSPDSELTLALARPDGTSLVIADRVAIGALAPGASQTLSREVTLPADSGRYRLVASADPLDRVLELDESNNRAERLFVAANGVPVLFAATDRVFYAGGDDVRITLEVVNGGPVFSGSVAVAIEDAEGVLVEDLPAVEVASLPYGMTLVREVVWNTGTVFAGNYRARVRLLDEADQPVAEVTAPFTIGAFAQVTGAVETDRGTYPAGSTVRITGTVSYRAGNDALTGAEARIQVLPAGGDTLVTELLRPLGDLLPGSESSVAVDWPSGATAQGSYRVRLTAERAGQVLTAAETRFELTEGPLTLEGSLSIPDRAPSWGIALAVTYALRNRGSAALSQLPVRVRILDPATGGVPASHSASVDLPAGGTANREAPFDTRTLGLGNRLAILEADLPTGTVTLDAASLTVVDRTPPDVSVAAPAAGSILRPDVEVFVVARDGLSPVRQVELSRDGGGWLPLDLRDPVASRYGRTLAGLSDGVHAVKARATDSWGNLAETGEVVFTVDGAPPVITVTGVEDGATYDDPVTPAFTVTDAHLRSESATLNGQPFVSGTQISEAGSYELRIEAEDMAGNRSAVTVSFTLGTGEPQLVASKQASLATDADQNDQPSPGDILEYQVTIANEGSAEATEVTFTDPAPAHTEVVAGTVAASTGTVVSEDPVKVEIGRLGAGESVTVTFRVTIDNPVPAGFEEVSNQGTVTSQELPAVLTDDPGLGGASDPTVTLITAAPKLVAEKSDILAVDADGDGAPSPGDTIEYRIAILNTGNTSAIGVVLADAVPAHATLVPGSVRTSAGTVESEDPVRVAIGEIAGGERVEVTFRVAIDNPVGTGVREIRNQGTVTSAELPPVLTDDPETGEADDPTLTAVSAAPMLRVEKTDLLFADADGDGVTSPGDAVLYRLTVRNAGNTGATGVVLTDPIPANASLVAGTVQTSQGTVEPGLPVRVALGEVAAGATVAVSFQVRVDEAFPHTSTELANQATVASGELEDVTSDDPDTPEADDPTRTPVFLTPDIGISDVAVDENAGQAVLTVTLSRAGNREVRVSWATGTGTALAGADYTASSGVLTFAPGETAKTLAVPVLDDLLDELEEAFPVVLSDPVLAKIADQEGVVTISDNDSAPQLSVADASVTEGDDGAVTAAFVVALSTPSGLDVTVSYSTADGTARTGSDYEAASGTLLIPAGATSQSVEVRVIGDVVDELDEIFTLTLSSPVAAGLARASGVGTILDDDEARVSVGDAGVDEGNTGTAPLRLPVTLSTPSEREIRVDWSATPGTATEGSDYTASSGAVVFPAGVASLSVEVPVHGDLFLEPDETLFVDLALPAGEVGTVIEDGRGVGTIRDDEACPGPELLVNAGGEVRGAAGAIPGWTVVEGNWQRRTSNPAPAEGAAYLSAGTATPAELRQDVDVSAFADLIATGDQAFRFAGSIRTAAESPSDVARIVVEYRDASNTLVLDAFDTGEIASPAEWRPMFHERVAPAGTGWIRVRLLATRFTGTGNDAYFDGLSLVSLRAATLAVGDVTVYEGHSGATPARFPVRLACPVDREVSVTYATANGTAVAGQDYLAASGSLTFPAGATSAEIPVSVLSDQVHERHETFQVLLSEASPDSVVDLDAVGIGTILNEDFCPRSPGFWKNHQNVWPIRSLLIGAMDYQAAGMLALLSYSGSDASNHLARQLVATKLNLLVGSPPSILPVVGESDAFLTTFPPGSNPKGANKTRANSLKDALDAYNNPSCKEVPVIP